MDVETIVKGLNAQERQYLHFTPMQEPADAGMISCWSGERRGGSAFAGFARRNPALFQRVKNIPGTGWLYRLTPFGCQVRAALQENHDVNPPRS